VIKVEGSRSYKAIAFIKSKSNRRNPRLKTNNYFKLRMTLKKTVFPKTSIFSFGNPTRYFFNKKLGDEKWKR